MTGKAAGFGFTILVAFGLTVGYTGWKVQTSATQSICRYCGRSSLSHSRTISQLDNGKKQAFCCPSCALSAIRGQRSARILEFTDYLSNTSLPPEDAYLVVGSSVNHCFRDRVRTDSYKQPVVMDFDRCAPGVVAFGLNREAEMFVRAHGGRLVRFDELRTAYGQ